MAHHRDRSGADRGAGSQRLGDSAGRKSLKAPATSIGRTWNCVCSASMASPATGRVALPDGKVHDVKLTQNASGKYQLEENPLEGDVRWRVTAQTAE